MTLVRAAVLLAFSRTREARWRQMMVILTTAISAFVVLGGAGLLASALRADDVSAMRRPAWSLPAEKAPIVASTRAMSLGGRQWPLLWLEQRRPVEQGFRAVPPGLLRLPGPGEIVLSPGLVAAGVTAQSLGMRPSTAGTGVGGTIGDDGLRSRSEGLAYAVPAAGRTLGSGGALIGLAGYGPGEGLLLDDVEDVPGAGAVALAGLPLVLAPVLYLIVSGARAMSPIRTARARTLFRLGIAPGRIRQLLALEGLILALAGAGLGAGTWAMVLRGRTVWPEVDAVLVPGSTELNAAAVLGMSLAVAAVSGLVSGIERIPHRGERIESRPSRLTSLLPASVGMLMMAIARSMPRGGSHGVLLLVGGALVFLGGVPAAVPTVAQRLAPVLGRLRGASAWLASRRLRNRSTAMARPALVVALLVFAAGAGQATYEYASAVDAEYTTAPNAPRVAHVDWRGELPGDISVVLPRLATDDLAAASLSGTMATVGSCAEADRIATVLRLRTGCVGSGLDPTFVRWVSETARVSLHLASPDPRAYEVLVVAPHDVSDVRIARAFGGLPAVNISHLDQTDNPSSMPSGWLLLGWLTGLTCAVLALIREIGDRAVLAAVDDQPLARLGLPEREVELVHALTVALPVIVAAIMGWLAAVAFAMVGDALGVTLGHIGAISRATLVTTVGALALLGGVLLGTRGLRV